MAMNLDQSADTITPSSGTLTVSGRTSATNIPATGTVLASVTAPATNPVTGTPSSSNFLRGDGTWAVPTAGSGTVTSVAATVPAFLSIAGSPITTSGTLAISYSGTALPVANGGTATTTAFTTGSVVYAGASGVYSQDNANFFWDATNHRLGIGNASPGNYSLNVTGVINSNSTYTSYVSDGLYGATALPGVINTGGGNNQILFGYIDNAAGAYAPRIGFYNKGGGVTAAKLSIGASIDGRLTFNAGTSNTEYGCFDTGGNFVVGATSYANYGNNVGIHYDANGGVINVGHTTGSGSGAGYILFGYNSGGIGSITQVGTTAVLYNTTSDYRLKTDVIPLQNALTTLQLLNPVSFTWVDGRKDDGFLAHELQAILPNCVTGQKDAVDKDGNPVYQQMDNSGVIPFLVAALNELNNKFDAYVASHP